MVDPNAWAVYWQHLDFSRPKAKVQEHFVDSSLPQVDRTAAHGMAYAFQYAVQAGDTIYTIAQRFNVDMHVLLAVNPQVTDANQIFPGWYCSFQPTSGHRGSAPAQRPFCVLLACRAELS